MRYRHNKKNVPLAKSLRKNMTPEERRLWYDYLRTYPVRILRQKPIGNYIVDFYCARAKLVIEIDGAQHYEPEAAAKDAARTAALGQYGLKVVRVSNQEIKRNLQGVCDYLDLIIQARIAEPRRDRFPSEED